MKVAMDLNNAISKYVLVEQLYADTRTIVYRAMRDTEETGWQPVTLKVLRQEYPTFNDLVQFRNQYAIAKHLDLTGIVRPYSLEPYRNGYVLVMEDFGGVSLRDYASTHNLSSIEVLKIGLQIATILHELHQNRVIHKDIKPANILIHPQTKQVKLIDFSIASLLPKETQEVNSPNGLEGTLAYLAPEQTGRMNRSIDYRADFYALGVTLFELITGQLPFQSDDPMELVHCHIAKQPPLLEGREEKIPPVISDIVMKLMAKNAEDRYQSALGLKYDLETCLDRWEQTGAIADFPIAQRDVCDRFLIPEKLYGRELEVKTLLAAFDRVAYPENNRVANGKSELMLVAGFSGIGKTAVVNEIHKPIARQRGYFIKGKFDQFNRNVPFSAFVQAFRDFMGQLLSESDRQLQSWRRKILAAVGENGQVIIEVVPELEYIIGQQPPTPELSGMAAQNRFHLVFQKFIQVFTDRSHPLVIFLDDLQWADSASLNLIKLLISESESGYLLLIGAYRDNEVFPAHPLMLTLDEIKKAGATLNSITLTSLSRESLNLLVADTLNCSAKLAQLLTESIYQKTKGNPFFTTQFLKALYQDGLIKFDDRTGKWQCDISQVRSAALTDDVVEFMATQLQKIHPETQEVLKLAACIGNQFDLNTLSIVSENSETEIAAKLWQALQEGYILPQSEVYKFYLGQENENITAKIERSVTYKFLHDRVQQAAYSLIPEPQRKATHLQIGKLIQQNYSEVEIEEKLFDIVGHLNQGIELISEPKEREALAQFNLKAGRKARNSTAYTAAKVYLQTGIELLAENSWQNRYELALNLYVAAAEAAYLNADLDGMEQMAAIVLREANTILDKIKIYEIQIAAKTAGFQLLEAITIAKDALEQLGVELPIEANEVEIGKALQNLTDRLEGQQVAELVNLPVMSDRQIRAAIHLLRLLFAPIFLGMPRLLPLLSSKMVNLSLQFGNAPASTVGYGIHGMILCATLGDAKTGYEFGKLGLNLLDRFDVREIKSIVLGLFGSFIQYRREPLRSTIPILKNGYVVGMEVGDFLQASYNILAYFHANFFGGVELDAWESEIANYSAIMLQTKQDSARSYLKIVQQTVENLQEVKSYPDCLIGSAYDETVMLPKYERDNEIFTLAVVYIYKMLLAYLAGNYEAARNYLDRANLHSFAISGMIYFPILHFYAALIYLSLYSTQPEQERSSILSQVEIHQNILHEWAQDAPMNYLHKWYLVEAEKQRVLGNKLEAIELFDRAISGAKENEYLQEEALANELCAKFYLEWGKEKVAAGYIQEAYYCYARWGAKAKIDRLEQCYPQLLLPILNQQKFSFNSLETLATASYISRQPRLFTTGGTIVSDAFDLASVLKAAQALSSTIQLDELLKQLTQIILQYSGASKCILLFAEETHWQVRAIATYETIKLHSEPIENNPNLPIKLIHYVKNTQEVVVINNLKTDLPVIDDYLLQSQPKSVLCLPIVDRGDLVGIVYLKNELTDGVFTNDRLLVLNFLCSQAAISLVNARLYQQARTYAQQLEKSHLQIVQSEKMASLGNLIAGVAHEMNNPLGFLRGSLDNINEYIADVLKHLAMYRQHYPNPIDEIQNHAEDIDLEFLSEDLPNMVGAMQGACDRITNISTSLRTFSRADTDRKVPFNIHEGIDSTLLILKYRLKANQFRPAIEVIREYGNIPAIQCFPGQLNQASINILANAIDMFDEMAQTRSFAQLKANPLQITIQTEILADANQVAIRIRDNGLGIPESIVPRIFDHLFTTKGVGKGTGLGLSIARQIVVEKHGGEITVNSKLGQGTEFVLLLPLNT